MGDRTWTVTVEDAGLRLDKFLASADRLGSRGRAAAALERGQVFIDHREQTAADGARRLAAGDRVRVWADRPGSSKARTRITRVAAGALQVVYEDESLLVVNKPPGLLAVPLERRAGAPSVYTLLRDHFRARGARRPLVVHRIDRDTSGLVVFAKDVRSQAAIRAQFAAREPERVYWAVVYGIPEPPSGTWRDHLAWDSRALIQKPSRPADRDATDAISDYRVLQRFRDASFLEVRLRTGRRNQIRIQALLRGHPLVGETQYGPDAPHRRRRIVFGRQALHARRLAFRHPIDGRSLAFEAPLPDDLAALVARLTSSSS